MLDEGAKAWLAAIESRNKEAAALASQLQAEVKRNRRLTGAKSLKDSELRIQEFEAQKAAAQAEVLTETEQFFKKVFHITKDSPCALQEADGTLKGGLCATQMIVRQIADGTGVFTVLGTSLSEDMHPGLPSCTMLMAQESLGQTLVCI